MSKYKYDIPRDIRKETVARLRRYPQDKAEYEALQRDMLPSATSAVSGVPISGKNVGRPTESTAIRIIASPYLRRLEYDCKAVESVLKRLDQTDIDLIDLVYWKGNYTIDGAALRLNISRSAACYHINAILGLLAFEFGLINSA